LTKPFSPAELIARIKSHIRRYERLKGHTISEIIEHKGLEINMASHKVMVNGISVQLTTKEYELLLFLASNPSFLPKHIFLMRYGVMSAMATTQPLLFIFKKSAKKLRRIHPIQNLLKHSGERAIVLIR